MSLILVALAQSAVAGTPVQQRLLEFGAQPDVVLVPPASEPSPKLGSFVVPYTPPGGGPPDPARAGTYDVAPSSCSEALVFKRVDAVERGNELWKIESGIGAHLGLPAFGLSAGVKHKSIAGMEYEVGQKMIVDGGLAELEACCLQQPDRCTTEYISEYWYGVGKIWKMNGTESGVKTSLKQLEKLGHLDFGATKGWTAATEWDEPMFFAYRTQAFQLPQCEVFMNNLPEVEGKVLFTGVSARQSSEQDARRDARDDARRQVVRYLGETYQIQGDEVTTRAEALLTGVKDSLTCLDPVLETPEGPHYLARVRMYVPSETIEGSDDGPEAAPR